MSFSIARTLLVAALLAATGDARAQGSVSYWRDELGSSDPQARVAAARALGLSGDDASAAVPDLVRALGDGEAAVRRASAEALEAIGRPAGVAGVPLARLLAREAAPDVREAVSHALVRLGPWVVDAVPALVEGLDAPNAAARRAACDVLGRLGVASPLVAEALVQAMMRDADSRVRSVARAALKKLRVDLNGHVDDFVAALADADPAIRATAAEWLGELRPRPVGAVDSLVSTLMTDPSLAVREKTEQALREMGPEASSAVPRLLVALDAGERETREACASILGSISTGASGDLDALLESSLDDPELSVRLAARGALVRLARTTPAVFDRFVGMAGGDGPADRRGAAIDALGRLAEAAAPAVPSLLVALREGTEGVREEAAHALGRIGAPAFDALLPLRRAAAWDRSQRVRDAADKAIKSIRAKVGGSAPSEEPGLGGPIRADAGAAPAPAAGGAP